MRTVSFSDSKVQKMIAGQFVATYTNTKGDSTAGASFNHAPDEQPGPCGRGAGRQNVQTIFLTGKGKIFHVATGFLSTEDLVGELKIAREMFNQLKRQSVDKASPFVVQAQKQRLREAGFSQSEVENSDRFQNMMTSMISPSDFGMKVRGSEMLGNAQRQRSLKDAKYVIKNPLIDREQFEQNPGELVGHHKSFFGTNSAMNGLSQFK